MGYYEGEIGSLCCNNGYNNNGMGAGWEGLIGLVLVAGLLGNGNFGGLFGGGRNGNAGADFAGWQLGRLATTNDVASGFSTSEIMSDLNQIILSQSQGFAGVQQTLCQGFSGIDRAIADTNSNIANSICTLGYQNQAGFNALANQIASCCCDLKTINLENRYLNAQQTSEIVSAINAGNQRLVDIYTNDKIEALRAENVALKGRISDDYQADRIINKLSPCPSPAYIVPNPNCCYNYGVYSAGACGASIQ